MKCIIENGKAKIEQTNLEYYQNCSPEEFTKFLVGIYLHSRPMPLLDGMEEGYKQACEAISFVNTFNWLSEEHKKMIEPFDKEFISQELRDAWRKIEHLEEENRELREQLEKERELYYGDDDFADDDWGRE